MAGGRNRQATRGGGRRVPAWVLVLFGMVLGAGLALFVVAKGWTPFLRKSELPQPNPQAVAPAATEAPPASAKPPRDYEFFQVLPEAEVLIPDAELTAKARAEQQAPTTPPPAAVAPAAEDAAEPATAARYVLQAGSYPEARAAEEAKARLALAGFSARVLPVTINGRTWHRVRVGPYATAREVESAKRSLAENGFNAIALKEQ